MIAIPKLRFLPRTGQTVTAPTANYRAGDDGTYQAGERARNARALEFVDNGNGTCTDFATMLQWVKAPALIIPGAADVDPGNQILAPHGTWTTTHAYAAADVVYDDVGATYQVCAVAHTSGAGTFAQDVAAHPTWWRQTIWIALATDLVHPAKMAWNAAIDACEALVYAGFTDWRLPNYMELASIIDPTIAQPLIRAPLVHPALDGTYTSTSTTMGSISTSAAALRFRYGDVLLNYSKATACFVYPVRGGIVNTVT